MTKKTGLIILDGWGHGEENSSNAVYCASTPFTDSLYLNHPHAELRTDGNHVGLPEGQMGNSEVGHMNLGAGRIVYQDLVRINRDISNGTLKDNLMLNRAIHTAVNNNTPLHLIGLVSNGGVHSHMEHLKALIDLALHKGLEQIFIHVFTDGRDTDPKSGLGFIRELENHIAGTPVKIVSVIGRYYAMDRDQRWERISKAYHLLVNGQGKKYSSASEAIEKSYVGGITDEFVEASSIQSNDAVDAIKIKENDVVICFNYRTDRCRQITRALTQEAFQEYNMHPMALEYFTMTNYDDKFQNVKVLFDKDNLQMTLGEVLSKQNKTQVRIAETEKYPHVTFFFSGGRELSFANEKRIMINSPKVATYDLQPEMSAKDVSEAICKEMRENGPDFFCLNFANPDMVGHTGVFNAIVKAVETTDVCLKEVVECGLKLGYSFVILADHGNAEKAINDDGSPNTAHTTNPVPIWVITDSYNTVSNGVLADVAPTILKLMEVEQPVEMTGKILVS